jgi:hypothetical protein
MNTIIHTVTQGCGTYSGAELTQCKITLPAPPWGHIDRDDRRETMPRTLPIKGSRDWRRDQVLRHASFRKDNG